MNKIIKLVAVTVITCSTAACSFSGQIGSYVDKMSTDSEDGLRAHGQNLNGLIAQGKNTEPNGETSFWRGQREYQEHMTTRRNAPYVYKNQTLRNMK